MHKQDVDYLARELYNNSAMSRSGITFDQLPKAHKRTYEGAARKHINRHPRKHINK